jgi:hypothetical protein
MPRHEDDREDLLAEATALVERAGIRTAGYDGPVVIGFRRDGSASFYFGAEPVYQFTAAGALRRAFVDGLLFKAVSGRLVALGRERSSRAVELVRHELGDEETRTFLDVLQRHLTKLETALAEANFELVGEVPVGAGVIARARRWLTAHGRDLKVARSPRVG